MSGNAQVRSTAAISEFQSALAKFETRVENTLAALEAEIHRVVDWLDHDRPAHWKEQLRLANNDLHQAKINLERCLIFRIQDERPTCREERTAVKVAQARVKYCREKRETLRNCRRRLTQELFEYQGHIGKLTRMLETEMPRARGSLKSILRRLDAYHIERPAIATDLTVPTVAGDSSRAVPSGPIAVPSESTASPEDEVPCEGLSEVDSEENEQAEEPTESATIDQETNSKD